MRKKMNRRKSKSYFSATAQHVDARNVSPILMRGGYRL